MTFELGFYALGDFDTRLYVGTHDPFAALANQPGVQLHYLLELYPFNETKPASVRTIGLFPGVTALGDTMTRYVGGEVKERLSDRGFISEPTASDPNRLFLGRVTNPLQFDTNILSGDGFSGGSQSYGGIEIINADGKLDRFFAYHWSGRRVVVKAGALDFAYDDFATIFEGSIDNLESDDARIILTIRDNRAKTDKPVRATIYGGTGGLDGDDTLAGAQKPLCYGVVKNAPLVLVNYAMQIYQVHDGSIAAVDAVRDRGIILDYGGDVAHITTATPGPSQYVTQLSGGFIRLGSTPAGLVTADVQGDNQGSVPITATAIALKVLKTRLGVYSLSSADIDEGSFARLGTVLTGPAGLYINSDVTGSDVLDALFNPAGAYWTFTRQGMLYAGAVSSPTGAVADVKHIDAAGLRLQQVIPPAWRIKVGYAPAVVVQSENDLAGGVTGDVQSFVTEAFRYITYENENVRLKNNLATERVFETSLSNVADAQTLLARLAAVYSVKRMVFQVPVYKTLYRYFLGDVVRLTYDRYGLENGADFLVVGISDNAATGQTVLTLWG
ncbi:hypothetical protein K3G63_04720 [Hymenobacter sp. HSC-4F20]|uniref:hypothetical protein n=1 Tax=Hymenobacter sp. HSC-4F20 TaxID=2864135 RepID=UPI001C72B408|nr:hypothetical protein [Hymenobacter sp. HSC-4F20]MBX0289727.1 hypothetical protein [Hymenobacter sp. HSC-4F20]